eukprot:CAMPEP_0179059650 /NCGR_PEP_ID=MMETSP0796-20121207/25462_1 /TAXON_ID=73915 /ORGANISM="Pyrodinium bahamense, Strain pbaha01" /LENGTH=501 /DNA_ID=CAMNT_0020756413 /DNA_START=48 /DNA_END=1553 /DNA_ORIENTATION=+
MQALAFGLVVLLLQAMLMNASEGDALHRTADGIAQRSIGTAELEAMDRVSKQGVHIFAGMVEAFLHRNHLTWSEVHCMLSGAENITHLAYKASADLASALGALLSPNGTIAEVTAAAAELVLVIPQLEERLDSLVELLGRFLGPCLGDASEKALQEAGRHLNNLTYVSGHLRANGADIVRDMADAYRFFGARKFADFGRSMGRACRKVLLSRASVPHLPEGAPSVPQLVNMSAGILQGFFRKGVELDLSSETHSTASSMEDSMALRTFSIETDAKESMQSYKGKPLKLRIDLHKCVKANLRSFQFVVLGILRYFAQQELASESDPMEALPAMLTSAMVEAPVALSKCGLGEEQLEMLVASLEALDGMHVQLKLPKSGVHFDPDGPVGQLQKAAEDWKALHWFALGEDLGRLLLQLLVQVFPEKYAVDDTGGASKRLNRLAVASAQGSKMFLRGLLLLLVEAMPLLAIAAVLRRRRDTGRSSGASPHSTSGDLESAMNGAVE